MDAEQTDGAALCRHCRILIECEYCQTLAFLSINRYDVGLPHIIEDIARLLLKQLTALYDASFMHRVIEQQREMLQYRCCMELSGSDDRASRWVIHWKPVITTTSSQRAKEEMC